MRENPHSTPDPGEPAHYQEADTSRWRCLVPWTVALWLIVATGILLGPLVSQRLLDRLPVSEPDPIRRADQVGLIVSRLMLKPTHKSTDLDPLLDLWTTLPSLDANDCLYAAMLAERAGHQPEARLWLTLRALALGDRHQTEALLKGTQVSLDELERLLQAGGRGLASDPLGQRLKAALATE